MGNKIELISNNPQKLALCKREPIIVPYLYPTVVPNTGKGYIEASENMYKFCIKVKEQKEEKTEITSVPSVPPPTPFSKRKLPELVWPKEEEPKSKEESEDIPAIKTSTPTTVTETPALAKKFSLTRSVRLNLDSSYWQKKNYRIYQYTHPTVGSTYPSLQSTYLSTDGTFFGNTGEWTFSILRSDLAQKYTKEIISDLFFIEKNFSVKNIECTFSNLKVRYFRDEFGPFSIYKPEKYPLLDMKIVFNKFPLFYYLGGDWDKQEVKDLNSYIKQHDEGNPYHCIPYELKYFQRPFFYTEIHTPGTKHDSSTEIDKINWIKNIKVDIITTITYEKKQKI